MTLLHCAVLIPALLWIQTCAVRAGKILVYPVDGSHWVNMDAVLRELHRRGHELTVVRSSSSWYIPERAPHYTSLTVHLAQSSHLEKPDLMAAFLKRNVDLRRGGGSIFSFVALQQEMIDLLAEEHQMSAEMVRNVLKDERRLEELREAEYDLILTDPGFGGGVILGAYLRLPMVFNVRWITSNEGHQAIVPSPLSYIPDPGTLLESLGPDLSEVFASAFARLPQKVVWRQKGTKPSTLGNNTLILDWLPQNDLLGHPKTRAFITHGGTNGIYEAVYHGVPMLGIPLIFDQFDNMVRLKERGVAKVLDVTALDVDALTRALLDILDDTRQYRRNVQRLSQLHRDTPMKPMDSAIFWLEFVMRHKGAAHLRTESYRMPWYAYHSVDVLALLLGMFISLFVLFGLILKFLFSLLTKGRKVERR
ncbi:LOW QUALITY PROTEIN: UDP glucuronosyltransferase 5 family, polypeptide E1 [Trichomycterus rosablanca]|uniref:LOW QUALITY PROTEIN: UDP glucuronosyltransferase 5 family, polypeptide E1 n=1 Tax=Trichomycterus rosablanca TaxID=2290929 RepID=UPI002F3581B4